MKLFGLQMNPWWCYHVAGASCREYEDDGYTAVESSSSAVVRVVSLEGRVQLYKGIVGAGEVMAEHPKHLLCHWDSLVIGQPVPAISAGEKLLPGRPYFLLPAAFFHSSPLTFLSLAAISASKPMPAFNLQKTDSGKLRLLLLGCDNKEEVEDGKTLVDMKEKSNKVCTTEALVKEYRRLVGCRNWKPKLETIRECGRDERCRSQITTVRWNQKETIKEENVIIIIIITTILIILESS